MNKKKKSRQNRILEFYRSQSIHKNLWLFLIAFIVTNAVIFIFIYSFSVKQIKNAAFAKMDEQASSYLNLLDDEILNIRNWMNGLQTDRKLAFLIYPSDLLSDYELRDAYLTEQERLSWAIATDSMVKNATIYLPNSSKKISNSEISSMVTADYDFVKANIKNVNKNITFSKEKIYMCSTGTNYVTSEDEVPDMFIVVEFNKKSIEKKLNQNISIEGSASFLCSSDHQHIISSNVNETLPFRIIESINLKKPPKTINIDHISYQLSVEDSDYFGKFIQYSPVNIILRDIIRLKMVAICYVIAMLIIAYVYSKNIQKRINRPLQKLLASFNPLDKGELVFQTISHEYNDEFGDLFKRFSLIQEKISYLVQEVITQKSLAQEAELKQLQTQINPHFLYNSFFSLKRKIQRGNLEEASELASHLGSYFQFLTKNYSSNVSLREEVDHAKSYSSIQATRFANRIKVYFDLLPDGFAELRVPRLIIQPVIENAFRYGLENKEDSGILKISYTLEKHLEIHVEDNGEELEEETLSDIIQKINNFEKPTGLGNINKRIKLCFGDEYGLEAKRSFLGGLEIIIHLPTNN